MSIDEIAADILKTYGETPAHLTGPPLLNWQPLWDEGGTDSAFIGALRRCPTQPADVARAHNVLARSCRAADIKALADKYGLSAQSVRSLLPRERVSSVTGSPRPTWADAWRMAREIIGDGPHSAKTIQLELEAVGMTNVQYHINTEAYPAWVTVKVVKRGDTRARRVFSFEGWMDE